MEGETFPVPVSFMSNHCYMKLTFLELRLYLFLCSHFDLHGRRESIFLHQLQTAIEFNP